MEPVEEAVDGIREDATWAEDQEKRAYYYDDAHGYEVFVPVDETGDEPNSEPSARRQDVP
jgi:hypothetical protein